MALFSLIAVLLLEQIRPLPYRQIVVEPLSMLAQLMERLFNAGEHKHGLIAWLLAVGSLVLLSGGVYFALYAFSPLLAWLFGKFTGATEAQTLKTWTLMETILGTTGAIVGMIAFTLLS